MQAFPFTSMIDYDSHGYPQFDRAVDSLILRNIVKQYVTNGVFPNPSTNFQVVANSGTAMTVKVLAGSCVINGATGYEVEDRVLTVQAADTKDRIDTVVLRLNDDTQYRNIDLYIVQGTPDFTPQAPVLTRSADVYELGIANIFIPANGVTITQERITDTRLDTERCGYAMFMSEIDTTALYKQIQSDLEHFRSGTETDVADWIEELKDKISKADAAKLQIEIDDIEIAIESVRREIEEDTSYKVGYYENALLGAHNLLPYPYVDTTKTENGIAYTDNNDGTVKLNGKNTVDVLYNYFVLLSTNKLRYFRGKSLKFTTGNTNESVHVQIWKKSTIDTEMQLYKDFVNVEEFEVTEDDLEIEIRITPIKNMDVNNVVIKPMILLATDTSSDFTNYTKTVEQLTAENDYKTFERTLSTGEEVITITDRSITDDSIVDIYTNVYGVSPKEVTQTEHTVQIKFRTQKTDIKVKVVVRNGMV